MADATEFQGGTFEPVDDADTVDEASDIEGKEEKEIIENKSKIDTSNIVYKNVFRKDDAEVYRAVMELYNDELDEGMSKENRKQRLKFLCVVAFDGDKAIGVSTITMEASPALWVKIGFFRCIVREEYRRNGIATQLGIECKRVLAAWTEENPKEQLKAIGVYTHVKMFGEKTKHPVWKNTGLTLAGYNDAGMQIRLSWFENAKVKY